MSDLRIASASDLRNASDLRIASASTSATTNPKFLAAGQQGCIYDGEFKKIREQEGCKVIPGSTAQPRTITKIMKDLKGYKAELAAARVLAQKDPTMQRTVYATRGCRILIQTILTKEEVKTCNEGTEEGSTRGTNEQMPEEGEGYSIEMPFVHHIPLKKYETPISLKQGLKWFAELEEKINKLHEWGIYHNDLHYGNVWVVGDSLKIADFGLADVSGEKSAIKEQKDIKTSAPSFQKIWALVREDERYGKMTPGNVLNAIDLNGRFINPNEALAESSHKRRRGYGSPLAPIGFQLGSPEGSPPAPSSAAKRPTARSLFD